MPVDDYDRSSGQAGEIETTRRASTSSQPTPEQQAQAVAQAQWNDQRATWDPKTGSYTFVAETDVNKLQRNALYREQQRATTGTNAPPTVPTTPPPTTSTAPPAPGTTAPVLSPLQRLQALEASTPQTPSFFSADTIRAGTRPAAAPKNLPTSPTQQAVNKLDLSSSAGAGAAPPPQPGDAAPDVDRSKIDPLLRNVSTATSGLMGLAQIEEQSSRAEAQLRDAAARASQAALGQARGGNRRDRAFMERQALAEGQFNMQQVGRDTALLRAQEEVDKNNLRLAAYKAAGDLGLNAGALELDVERIDMESATNWINNEFENHRLGLQIDQQEAERVANFARDMALIEQQYYTLSIQERQHIRDDLTRKYGISEQTRAALATADAANDWNWNQFASGLIGGITSGVTAGIVK